MPEIVGRFPFATLSLVQERGFGAGVAFQRSLKGRGTVAQAKEYVRLCQKTQGYPHLYDLLEREGQLSKEGEV